jgi:hypothetical protein
MKKIIVEGIEISLSMKNNAEYISMTDIAKKFGEPRIIVQNWMRSANTLDFLAVWEQLYNPSFNRIEFDAVRLQAGSNAFTMSPTKWIETMNAVGIVTKSGRYGSGSFAHSDIALEFCSWLSPVFKLYILREFQRMKEEESRVEAANFDWNIKRIMSKANYQIHTEAVRQHLVPPKVQKTAYEGIYFASEADVLNVALFGHTAKQWKEQNQKASGNMRDQASPEQLLVLSNLQSLNARLLKWQVTPEKRLEILNETAIEEMEILLSNSSISKIATNQKNELPPSDDLS